MDSIDFEKGTFTVGGKVYTPINKDMLVSSMIVIYLLKRDYYSLRLSLENYRDLIMKEKGYPLIIYNASWDSLNLLVEVYYTLFPEITYVLKDILYPIMKCSSLGSIEFIIHDYLMRSKRKLLTKEETYDISCLEVFCEKKLEYIIKKSEKGVICSSLWISELNEKSNGYITFITESIKKGDIFIKSEPSIYFDHQKKGVKEIKSLVKWVEMGVENMLLFNSSL